MESRSSVQISGKLVNEIYTVLSRFSSEIDERWQLLFHHVLFHCCMYEIENDEIEFAKHKKRLFWLHYCVAQHEYNLEKAVDWLYTVSIELHQNIASDWLFRLD